MSLVRCPTHGILYNEKNPRGCPACFQEKQGRRSQASVMQDLARASRKVEGEPEPARPAPPSAPPREQWPSQGPKWYKGKLVRFGPVVIIALVAGLLWASRPSFVAQASPATFSGAPRPLPVNPRQPISVVFAVLGTKNPTVHPRDGSVARYSYGTELTVDAINGFVYSIQVGVPNRTWRGLQVGMSAREADGRLALLGDPIRGGSLSTPTPQIVSGYQVYASSNDRPIQTLTAEVRPPNGCFDAIAVLQPRQIGLVIEGERRYSAVAPQGGTVEWVVTRIRVVDRSRNGPLDTRAC